MPNIASILKAEISRVARKEIRAEVESLRKTTSSQRTEIASLKRRLREVELLLKKSARASTKRAAVVQAATPTDTAEDVAEGLRFRAAGLANNRKRLELSAHDFGLLVGATGQSVYAWEQGKSKPNAKSLAAIAALRGVGKREIATRLNALKA